MSPGPHCIGRVIYDCISAHSLPSPVPVFPIHHTAYLGLESFHVLNHLSHHLNGWLQRPYLSVMHLSSYPHPPAIHLIHASTPINRIILLSCVTTRKEKREEYFEAYIYTSHYTVHIHFTRHMHVGKNRNMDDN